MLRDLHHDGLISGVAVEEVEYPVRITALTLTGRSAVTSG